MLYANSHTGVRIEAAPGLQGWCPGCADTLIPRCGEVNIWHWAHRSRQECDPWWESETRWHRQWKQCVPEDCREVVWGPHRADIRTSRGWVIELQHSAIDPSEIQTREAFYGKMVWLIDAREFAERIDFRPRDGHTTFRWAHPRPSYYAIRKPLFWDVGQGNLFEVKKLYPHRPGAGPCAGWGCWLSYADFLRRFGETPELTICGPCDGNGHGTLWGPCRECDGLGTISPLCPVCHGTPQTEHPCVSCQGLGLKTESCEECGGEGSDPVYGECDRCEGRGTWCTDCRPCSGRGMTVQICRRCDGLGWLRGVCPRCHGDEDWQDAEGVEPCPRCHGVGLAKASPFVREGTGMDWLLQRRLEEARQLLSTS